VQSSAAQIHPQSVTRKIKTNDFIKDSLSAYVLDVTGLVSVAAKMQLKY
jgi:hypothetical protein